ncbi:MAG: RT0821/Lpp0805 family surface protein [Rickettsiales bacterium]
MNRLTLKIAVVASIIPLVAACQNNGYGGSRGVLQGGNNVNKQDIGTLAGAIGGGVIGHNIGGGAGQTAATIAGTLLGAAIGNSVGSSLDRADIHAYNLASQRALETSPSGQALPWKNSETGTHGAITPSNYYQNSSGQYCREYNQVIIVAGKRQTGYGTACREPDGSWKIVE